MNDARLKSRARERKGWRYGIMYGLTGGVLAWRERGLRDCVSLRRATVSGLDHVPYSMECPSAGAYALAVDVLTDLLDDEASALIMGVYFMEQVLAEVAVSRRFHLPAEGMLEWVRDYRPT